MTRLSNRKTRLQFTTDSSIRGRDLVIEPEPLVCNIRLKGSRIRYSIACTKCRSRKCRPGSRRCRSCSRIALAITSQAMLLEIASVQ